MLINFLSKYQIFLLLFVLLNIFLINFFFFQFTTSFSSDSQQYMETVKYFRGLEETVYPHKLLKPLVPVLVTLFSFLFGFNTSFLLVNSLFYLFIGFLLFKIIKLRFDDDRQSLVGSLLFMSVYPMLEYGISFMTDIAGWFFFIFSVYLTLFFLRNPSVKLVVANGLVSALGILAKESGGVGAIFFALVILFVYQESLFKKIKIILLFALFFALLPLLWQLFIYLRFHYTYYHWFVFNWSGALKEPYIPEIIKITANSLGATFLLGWVFVLIGIIRWKDLVRNDKKVILALLYHLHLFYFRTQQLLRDFFTLVVCY